MAAGLLIGLVFHWWSLGGPLIGGGVGATLAALTLRRPKGGEEPRRY